MQWNIFHIVKMSALAILFTCGMPLFTEETRLDLNRYYSFPLSIGLEYQACSYLGENRNNNDIMGMAVNARFPLRFWPVLQPSLEAGFINVDRLDPDRPEKLDHSQFYLLPGVVYTNRFLKNFEYGLEAAVGLSYMAFPYLTEDGQITGSLNLLAQAGLYLCLDPGYNFSIAFHPTLKYFQALTPSMSNYNGFVLGTGLVFHYRFGEDPDLPRAPLESLTWGEINLPPVYANMQQFYTNHPLGTFTLINPQKYPVTDIEVYFSQKSYMDSPRYCGTVARLNPGETREVDLYATFTNAVFDIEGSEPLNGEISIAYKALGRSGAQRKSIAFELNDKTTLIWDDFSKLAALITPADGSLLNYGSYIQRACEPELAGYFNKNLQLAMQLYHALTALNIVYQPDPVLPFSTFRSARNTVKDKVNLARDTLKRGSGDCDDLTVLFCSLLECIGLESGYCIVDGHILPVFNTKEEARAYADLHPDRAMTVPYYDELWIPVEMTLVGQADFYEAWRKGIEIYKVNKNNRKFFPTREAWKIYHPVGLKEKDLGLQYGDIKAIKNAFKTDLSRMINAVVTGYEHQVQEKADKTLYNTLGSLYGAAGQFARAEDAFKKALALDGDYIFAKINLGVLFIHKKSYNQALSWLTACLNRAGETQNLSKSLLASIYTNLSLCYKALGDETKARECREQADILAGGLVAENVSRAEESLNREYRTSLGFVHE